MIDREKMIERVQEYIEPVICGMLAVYDPTYLTDKKLHTRRKMCRNVATELVDDGCRFKEGFDVMEYTGEVEPKDYKVVTDEQA